jgi:hypothetical protein
MNSSSWVSINSTLNNNCCWICGKKFPKKMMKKVFMISQVIHHFKQIFDSQPNGYETRSRVFRSENLQECYNEFLNYNQNIDKMIEYMKVSGVEPWMSGLACGNALECEYDVDQILSISPNLSLQNVNSLKNECPPNCGCDNPWAFVKS